jgi:murein L,D-transpeptidase YafK
MYWFVLRFQNLMVGSVSFRRFRSWALPLVVTAGLAACSQTPDQKTSARHHVPVPAKTVALMQSKGMSASDPILIRSYKKEAEMEVWKRGSDGKYALLKTFPICRWSGQLGPKQREGDRQAPEGFYTVNAGQLNPNSSYHLSFDTGYPNALDRSLNRTGSNLMVHGSCSSRGCFAMTDDTIEEVYALAREALVGGQKGFQFQSLPFRMTAENMAKHRYDPNMAFWRNLKEGSDHFEVLKQPPKVAACSRKYVFNAQNSGLDPSSPCPQLDVPQDIAAAVGEKQARDQIQVAELIRRGAPAVKLVYEDGGQHRSFTEVAQTASDDTREGFTPRATPRVLGDVSRPEALVAPREIALTSPLGSPIITASLPTEAPQKVAALSVAQATPVVDAPKPEPQKSAGLFSGLGLRSFLPGVTNKENK